MYISIFLSNVTHIIRDTDFPLFCSNSARKCLILPAECSPQKSLILLEILPTEFIQAYVQPTQRQIGLVSQSRLEKIHKRVTGIAAVLDPQVGLTHSTDVVYTILFLKATSFNSFHFLSIGNTFTCAYFKIEGARRNKQWASCRRYLFLFPAHPISLLPSPF